MRSFYLVIKNYYNPTEHVRTHIKGWTQNVNNWKNDEVPELTGHVSKTDIREASIIIDIVQQKVIKNRYKNGYNFFKNIKIADTALDADMKLSDEHVLEFYKKKYPQYLPNIDQLKEVAKEETNV